MKELIKINGTKEINGKEIKVIEGGFGEGCKVILVKDIAIAHSLEVKYINKLINNNIKRFKYGVDIIDLKTISFSEHVLETLYTKAQVGNSKNIYALSDRGYAKLCSIMRRDEKIASIVLKEYFDSDIVVEPSNTKEYYFYEELSEYLEVFNLQGIIQYKVLNYKIDYYIPKLNIAIEYDENDHKGYTYEQQEGRQRKIEKELGCRFIRVNDSKSDSYNIGLVAKELLKIEEFRRELNLAS